MEMDWRGKALRQRKLQLRTGVWSKRAKVTGDIGEAKKLTDEGKNTARQVAIGNIPRGCSIE